MNGDGKSIMCGSEKVLEKTNWTAIDQKVGLHLKKVMLYIWCDWKGIVYYELLSQNKILNSDKCWPIPKQQPIF